MILNKYEKEYNSKLDFKMLTQLNKARSISESLSKQKQIFNKLSDDVNTSTEIHLKKSVQIYDFLNSKAQLTVDDLVDAYMFYEDEKIDKTKLESIIKVMHLEIDEFLTNPIKVLMFIVRENIFNRYSDEMAILLFNWMLLKNGYHPVIFYNTFMSNLSELIKNGAMSESIYRVLVPTIEVSVMYNELQGYISINDIKDKIVENKIVLKEKYKVNHIYIYGSIAQETQTKYSDIDLLLIVEEYSEFKNSETKKYIQSLFKQRVDLIFVTDAGNKMNMDEDFYTKRKKIY